MGRFLLFCSVIFTCAGHASPAHAEFLISSAILEFYEGGPSQQDIELISRSDSQDYIVSEVSEILRPGSASEQRIVLDDPTVAGLLVTPDKTVLAAGARKLLRFVLLRAPETQEHIYRVTIKPVIKGIDHASKIGLKVLVGYEVLVIVRPTAPVPAYQVARNGRMLAVTNTGNTNVLFQNGQQCQGCALPPVMRVYPAQKAEIELPLDQRVTYTVWNGVTNEERRID